MDQLIEHLLVKHEDLCGLHQDPRKPGCVHIMKISSTCSARKMGGEGRKSSEARLDSCPGGHSSTQDTVSDTEEVKDSSDHHMWTVAYACLHAHKHIQGMHGGICKKKDLTIKNVKVYINAIQPGCRWQNATLKALTLLGIHPVFQMSMCKTKHQFLHLKKYYFSNLTKSLALFPICFLHFLMIYILLETMAREKPGNPDTNSQRWLPAISAPPVLIPSPGVQPHASFSQITTKRKIFQPTISSF